MHLLIFVMIMIASAFAVLETLSALGLRTFQTAVIAIAVIMAKFHQEQFAEDNFCNKNYSEEFGVIVSRRIL
jgi:hypothetical protein